MKTKHNLAAVLLAIFVPSFFAFFYFFLFADKSFAQILYSISRVFLVVFPIGWVLLVNKSVFPRIRFKTKGLFAGILSGLIIGGVILLVYFLVFKGRIDFSEIKLKAEQYKFTGINYFFYAFFLTIINSSIEEYYWRWFTLSKLRNLISDNKAIFISAVGFTLHHIIVLLVYFGLMFGLLFSIGVFIGGIIWAYFYKRYDSILPCIISHLIVDAALMIIGYDVIFA